MTKTTNTNMNMNMNTTMTKPSSSSFPSSSFPSSSTSSSSSSLPSISISTPITTAAKAKAGSWTAACHSFDDMGLGDQLLHGIYSSGYQQPSPVQALGCVPCASSRDVVVQAQAGTGKTATFAIGLLHKIDPARPVVQAVVLSPTRELAHQTCEVVARLGRYMGGASSLRRSDATRISSTTTTTTTTTAATTSSTDGVRCVALTGGVAVKDDVEALSRGGGAQVVVGTPGRILDLLDKRILDPTHVRSFVVDEADELLLRGMNEQLFSIFRCLPFEAMQSVLVSATMPPEALTLADRMLQNALRILVPAEALPLKGIRQFYVELPEARWKYDCIADLYAQLRVAQSIIFVNSCETATWLAARMNADDHTVACIHSDLTEPQRREVMDRFRRSEARVLIATGVLERGIDVQQVSLVINYDIPRRHESYIHRAWRCGRWGRKGVVVNLLTPGEQTRLMEECVQHYRLDISELPNDDRIFQQL